MHLFSFMLCLSVGALVKCAAGSDWCYTGCEHTPAHWKDIPGTFCGKKRQSPIDIVTSNVKPDQNLLNFTFVNFSSQHVIKSIVNNGHTVKCILAKDESEVSGGGLNGTYSTIQFHLHWGDTEHHPGSEHMVDGHRYPMEMHIVSLKKGVEKPTEDSEGIAVLGFFINATEDGDMSGPWSKLTSYLTNVTGTEVDFNHTISLDDLIGNVNLTKFYRYMGSLTTPNCNEAVVWTVFQEPININKNLIQKFPMETGISNVFRPAQQLYGRQVFASPATPLPPSHSWCYDEHCHYTPSNWPTIPGSHCGGERQSPINIKTEGTVLNKQLKDFTFTKFDEKHAIKYIINTGHAVKCVLKDDMLEVSGGGLGHTYSTLQFHFHWGSTSHDSEGSEHTVDSHRYPMEMHIVNKRKDLSLEEAITTPNGLAVLGFFIKASDGTKSGGESEHHEPSPSKPTSDMDAWKKLTSYLSHIQNISSQADVTEEISIDDLLGNVNRASYYRYNGSLTTPSCNEAVVWTIFKEPVKIDENLMKMFPTHAGYHNVYRQAQSLHNRTIFTTASASGSPCPIMLTLLLACLCVLMINL
ncbi:carbonic anhydrase 4-like [Notolabrus celidotus]|uniref:carbonic anhydrase 4-like n=1 Tax=Notolabrus celidotus TaxID=1203425 RepID=UPI0014902018|nr:carbonic anhydrase 4-like [Notolabrus celidotus]XP_034563716.1 carbonic anhydrase 4-like [Notolabrus celidotus]